MSMNGPHHYPRRVGLALGGGAARGWAHIGVIQALREAGIRPDVVSGTSIGALVGAIHAGGRLDAFGEWVLRLGVRDVVSYLDFRLDGGMIRGQRLYAHLREQFMPGRIEELAIPYGAVATELGTGQEIWLREGAAADAVRASAALPGLFSPVWHENRLLADGGLVNPVPVSLARAMGADVLIAVDLNSDIVGRHLIPPQDAQPASPPAAAAADEASPALSDWRRWRLPALGSLLPAFQPAGGPALPGMMDVVANSIAIMQVRITRSRMAGEPPHVIIAPRLSHLGLMDFHRAEEAIAEGRRAVAASLPALEALGIQQPED